MGPFFSGSSFGVETRSRRFEGRNCHHGFDCLDEAISLPSVPTSILPHICNRCLFAALGSKTVTGKKFPSQPDRNSVGSRSLCATFLSETCFLLFFHCLFSYFLSHFELNVTEDEFKLGFELELLPQSDSSTLLNNAFRFDTSTVLFSLYR